MKKLTAYLMTALMVAAISVFAAVASDTHHSAHVKISENLIVGNTMVKKGDYKIRFDEVTGELTVKKMNGDLVATAIGHVIPMEKDAKFTALTMTDTDRGPVLTAV